MKQSFLTILATFVLAANLCAQIPNGYYNNATGKTGDDLKIALHNIIKEHTTINYSNIWNAFWSTDNKGNGVVWDMYSDIPNGTPAYTFSMGQNQCGEYVQEGDCYNREHSWPQSWFSGNDQSIPTRDLHHVFPTDGFVNSQRSNYPYGEVSTASWTSQNGSKLGTCRPSLGYNGTVFEPIDEYKGDFARALMYMSVRYYTEDDNWGTSGMTNKSEILPWAITMLMDWSDNDPVSQKEIDRNNFIYSDYQHNRNPFIDHPEYARMIWDPNWHGGVSGYVKVTSTNELSDGDYLIVCESNHVAFNGALTTLDATGNKIDVTISGNTIESNATTDAAAFTITSKTGGYSIKSASGYYIGNTSDANALKTSQSDNYTNTVSISNGNADIVCSSSHLRYNEANDQTRFRYFKSTSYNNQQAIQLYKKIEAYVITLASVERGSISANVEEAVEGATVILTASPDEGYELEAWTVTDAANNLIPVADNQFVMPASNVTVSATFTAAFSQQYHLVTNANQLIAGRTYLIVNTQYAKALGKTQNTNNRSEASVEVDNNVIASIGDAVCELILGGQAGAWTFFDANWGNNGGYLYAAGGNSNNYLKTQATLTNAGKWTISISGNKATIITLDSSVNRNTIMYNNSSNLFSCYASGQKDICLFIRSEEYDHTESEAIANIFPFDKHTIHSGATLTVTGTATCNDASHLILEEGAQLIHHNDGVMATAKKNIEAYTDNGGWYTIATPFSTYDPASVLASDDYDLYSYYEAGPLEWRNYKPNGNFSLTSGQGYLYAHYPAATLRMEGSLNNGSTTQTIELGYDNNVSDIKGFNLLGNPTAHDIGYSKTESVSDGYYYLNNSEAWVYTTATTVPVGRGFLVKANAENQSVTFNTQSKGGDNNKEGQYLCVSVGEAKTYIKLDEGVSMPLFALNGSHSPLYLTHENAKYVMFVRDGDKAIDLCYEPFLDKRQTLIAETHDLDLDYLHLIDNITGTDIDLLQTPEYTFDAKTSDYATRFTIVFSANKGTEGHDAPFAYFNGSEWIIQNEGMAMLQLVDLMGRIVSEESIEGNAKFSIKNVISGIYMIRLISNDAVNTQKIVIR